MALIRLNSRSAPADTYGSNIKEHLVMLCDGEDYTVPSGTYTPTNVTAGGGTGDYADLAGSVLSYTPPSGTTCVMYDFNMQVSANAAQHSIMPCRFYIDSDEVTDARASISANSNLEMLFNLRWVIPIGGTANAATGRQSSWTSAKTLKWQVRRHGSSNEPRIHNTYYFDGAISAKFHRPCLTITSLG